MKRFLLLLVFLPFYCICQKLLLQMEHHWRLYDIDDNRNLQFGSDTLENF